METEAALVFGITTFRNGARSYYLVWSAPAPADDSEPKYVKPLGVRMSLIMASKFLEEKETEYNAEMLARALAYADAKEGAEDNDPSPYAGDYSEE